jgi:hypothetical protein
MFDHDNEPDYDPGEALEYVLNNNWDEILERVAEEQADEWRRGAELWFRVLNCVGECDKEHSRKLFRRWLGDEPDKAPASGSVGPEVDEPDEEELFEIASRVARILEEGNSPYSELCRVGDDLSWARGVVNAGRSIRDLLLTLAEGGWITNLDSALKRFNSLLTGGPPSEVHHQSEDLLFGQKEPLYRRPNSKLTPLHSAITQSMAEYFARYREPLDLAVCLECSRIFTRTRRDNAYCSKTCQNRVAYKRKRIIDSGLLVEVPSEPAAVEAIRPGFWVNHPRWGLGVVEHVHFSRKLMHYSPRGVLVTSIPEHESVEEAKARVSKDLGIDTATSKEIREPKSLTATVRYLSGVVRNSSWTDFLGGQGKSRVAILEVKSHEDLLKLL